MTPQRHHNLPVELPPANRFNVLVVDDMPANRILLRKVLQSTGYGVIEAKDGAEALEFLLKGSARPDLIITDVEMPEMDGISMVRHLRAMGSHASDIPVIAASGNPDRQMQSNAMEAGADLFLTKPFELRILRREMATLLRSSQAKRALGAGNHRELNRMDAPAKKLV